MRDINQIIIHCADTPVGMDIGVEEIRRWHVEGNGWSDVGYHWIIRRDGTLEKGRHESVAGAHVRGHNAQSIGVCMVGGKHDCNFTWLQWRALRALVEGLTKRYSQAAVCGHRDLDPGKACPRFDARAWWGGAG